VTKIRLCVFNMALWVSGNGWGLGSGGMSIVYRLYQLLCAFRGVGFRVHLQEAWEAEGLPTILLLGPI